VFGEVIDEKSMPIRDVAVRLVCAHRARTVTTASDGAFEFDDIDDPLVLSFTAAGYGHVTVQGAELEKPGDLFWSQKLVRLKTGTGRVVGLVVDDHGAPVRTYRLISFIDVDPLHTPNLTGEQVRAAFEQRRNSYRAIEVNDPTGSFTFEVPVGRRTISVEADGFRPEKTTHVVDVVEADNTSVRIVIEHSNAVLGRVLNKITRSPISNAEIYLQGPDFRAESGPDGRTDERGSFELRSLPSSRVSILVRAAGYNSLRVGGVHGDRSRDEQVTIELTPLDAAAGDPEKAPREFVGIGITVDEHALGLVVTGVMPDGPAAGLETGDIIVDVDGMTLAGRSTYEGEAAIMGDEGSRTRITLLRSGQQMHFDIERRRLLSPPATK
jgi:hypothetical protein